MKGREYPKRAIPCVSPPLSVGEPDRSPRKPVSYFVQTRWGESEDTHSISDSATSETGSPPKRERRRVTRHAVWISHRVRVREGVPGLLVDGHLLRCQNGTESFLPGSPAGFQRRPSWHPDSRRVPGGPAWTPLTRFLRRRQRPDPFAPGRGSSWIAASRAPGSRPLP